MPDNLIVILYKGIFVGLWTDFIKPFWWFILLLLIIKLLPEIIETIRKNKKYSAINQIQTDRQILSSIRNLKPSEFEDYIGHLFNKLGFTTEVAGGSYDGGIDVIASKNDVKHYIQCKKFITSQVTVGAVRDFYGALVDRIANGKGYFITTNKFTLEAEKFADDKPIELIDGFKLLEYIKLAEKKSTTIITGNKINNCPLCDGKLTLREGKFGKFYGCSNYPKCKFTKKN